MVNYRRVLCEIAFLCAVVSRAASAPLHDCKDDRVYDQRQNGTENYRVNIDGVVIAVAPAESLLNAVSDIDLGDLLSDFDFEQELRPTSQATDTLLGEQPPIQKPDDKPALSKPGEDKPSEAKPDQPQELKPESPVEAPLNIPEKQQEKGHKKSAQLRKQENAQRLKHRLASIFLPFLRQRRHQ